MAHLLGAENLRLEFPTKVVLDGVTLGIDEGSRIGVVGRNGDGKSTLMSVLAGRLEPDDGRVTTRRGLTIGMLDQRDVLPEGVTVETDPATGDVHLVAGPHYRGVQFHAESILTQNGFGILRDLVTDLVG